MLLSLISCAPKVDKIIIVGDSVKHSDTWGDYVVIYPDDNGEWHYQIEWAVSPVTDKKPKVQFSINEPQDYVSVDSKGEVTFTGKGMAIVDLTIKRSDVTTSVMIIAQTK